ncbi:P-loop containing nucleoside triphosphate hydrolase protein, partial [Pelagophyceae sp. CCMP2097]
MRSAGGEAGAGDLELGPGDASAALAPRARGEVLLEARGVSYAVGATEILCGVSTFLECGAPVAIIGPSGAGKTTLLRILAGRASSRARVEGAIFAGGVEVRNAAQFGAFGALAPQDDVLLDNLTARESLAFAAELRGAAAERVDVVLSQFGLEERADVRAAALSGGQRKRLSISLEVVHAPAVLLVDEPTSGLDAAAARSVVLGLVALAKQTRVTLGMTIHQPAAEIFFACDHLLVLTAGRVAY